MLEQSATELQYLKGATILSVRESPDVGEDDDEFGWGGPEIWLTLRLAKPTVIPLVGDDVLVDEVTLAVMMDPEGNGPGFLDLVEAKGPVKKGVPA